VEAEWTVLGNAITGAKFFDPPFEFLGVWKITNYFTPILEEFASQKMLARGTGELRGERWVNLRDVNYPANFLNAVDQDNEGLGLINGHEVKFHGTRRQRGATPWIGNKDGKPYYLCDPDTDQNTASCPPYQLIGTTDTIATRSRKLRCGAKVMIQDVPGIKVRRDTGGGLLDGQVDVYIGEGGDAVFAKAKRWGEQYKWVINLLY